MCVFPILTSSSPSIDNAPSVTLHTATETHELMWTSLPSAFGAAYTADKHASAASMRRRNDFRSLAIRTVIRLSEKSEIARNVSSDTLPLPCGGVIQHPCSCVEVTTERGVGNCVDVGNRAAVQEM